MLDLKYLFTKDNMDEEEYWLVLDLSCGEVIALNQTTANEFEKYYLPDWEDYSKLCTVSYGEYLQQMIHANSDGYMYFSDISEVQDEEIKNYLIRLLV